MTSVQYIACTNNAGFDMNFSVQYLDSSGNWNTTEWNSGTYPIDQTRTSPDLGSIGVPSSALAVTPYVHAILGDHGQGSPFVSYSANGQTGTYEVKGATLNFSVDLISGGGVAKAEVLASASR
jgi:hypothetical protein